MTAAPARRGRPTQEEALQLYDRLADAAFELFVQNGYGGLTIEGLARSAQVNKRTIYSRFGSKEGLFEAAITRAHHRLTDPVRDELRNGSAEGWIQRSVELALRSLGDRELQSIVRFYQGDGADLPFFDALMRRRYRQSIEIVVELASRDSRIPLAGDELRDASRFFVDMIAGQSRGMRNGTPQGQDIDAYIAEWAPRLARAAARLFSIA